MIKKICFCILLFFCFILNIILDFNIKNYFEILNNCFNVNVIVSNKLYCVICIIIALISILIILDILLVLFKNKIENKGIKFKFEDGTHGTASWMNEKEMTEVLSFEKSGIILGKCNNKLVKLPFDSHFNKNICVFGSSGSMKTIRIFTNQFIRTLKI